MNSTFRTLLRTPLTTQLLGADLRSLALMRVLLGGVMLGSLIVALADTAAFWSDAGVLPRAQLIELAGNSRLSLFLANGWTPFSVLLMLVQAVLAGLLLIGWRTTWVTVASFVLWASLLSRNPLVASQHDMMVTALLFWSMFLPVGARYSVDAAMATGQATDGPLHLSAASASLLIYVIAAYVFSTLQPQDMAATIVAPHWLALAAAVLLLLPLPVTLLRWTRLAGLLLLALPTLWLLLRTPGSTAPYVGLAALSPLLGNMIWDWRERRHLHRTPGDIQIFYDGDCRFCEAMCRLLVQFLIVPRAILAPAQTNSRARTLMEANNSWVVLDSKEEAHLKWSAFIVLLRRSMLFAPMAVLLGRPGLDGRGNALYDFVVRHRPGFAAATRWLQHPTSPMPTVGRGLQALSVLILLLALSAQAGTAGWLSGKLQRAGSAPLKLLGMDANWTAPLWAPSLADSWLLAVGQHADGSELDLLRPRQAEVSYDRPTSAPDQDSARWRRYRQFLIHDGSDMQRGNYANYLCRQWNRGHDAAQQVTGIRLIALQTNATPSGIEQRVLLRQSCP